MDQKISEHNGADEIGCLFIDISVISEKNKGLNSTMRLKCNKCSKRFSLYTCEPHNLNNKIIVEYSSCWK